MYMLTEDKPQTCLSACNWLPPSRPDYHHACPPASVGAAWKLTISFAPGGRTFCECLRYDAAAKSKCAMTSGRELPYRAYCLHQIFTFQSRAIHCFMYLIRIQDLFSSHAGPVLTAGLG